MLKIISQENKQALRNPWVIGWLTLVLVVFGVNAGMVITAIVSNPGLVEKDYYEQGRDAERLYQERLRAYSELAWQVGLELPGRLVVGKDGVFRLHVADKHGVPISGAEVSLVAYRPSDADSDFDVSLKQTAPGQYDGFFALPLKGVWDLKVKISKAGNKWFMSRRVSVFGS